jgi:hypothetical protein
VLLKIGLPMPFGHGENKIAPVIPAKAGTHERRLLRM